MADDKKVLQLQPARSYELPGGPYASDLGETEVFVLSEFERGGDTDQAGLKGS